MTPLQALIKNIIAIGLLVWLFVKSDKQTDRLNFPVVLSITLASVLFIFLVGPMRYVPSATTNTYVPVAEDETETPETPASADQPSKGLSETAPVADPKATVKDTVAAVKADEPAKKKSGFRQYFADIDKGKKILCFFAPGCEHCRETAKQLTQMKKSTPGFPEVRIIFMDEEAELIPQFFEFAGATYPHIVMDVGQFWTAAANRDTPGVLYLWNGNLVKDWDGTEAKAFKQAELKKLVEKSWSELK
jgi:thiol-disulfide isomerase/thioredoxin